MDFVLNKIDKHLDNHRSLDQHRKNLKRKLEESIGLKKDTESIKRLELQPRKKLKAEVQIWLENVERVNGEVQVLEGRIGESNAFTRGFHREDVSKSMKEVEELITQQGRFHVGLVVVNPQWIGQVLSTTNLSGEAVKACVEKIWQCLMDDGVQKIGVWGMGGVGKTSIMKVINNQLLKETGKFDTVIWITVSNEMSIAKLQKDIASKIGVEFYGDEDETTRAGILFETLSQKSRFVMILDDLWEKVSLEKIGIPEQKVSLERIGNPEPSNGAKLVLTTRKEDVCRQMGCIIIKVKPLMEEEAWELFLERVGCDILNIPEVEPIARSIANRCAGLPLGIITIASCMKGIDEISEWRNAREELKLRKASVNGFEEEVFQPLQFSYDRLKNPKLQECFLSCVLYPEDEEIEEKGLIQLWIGEGLVEEMDSMQAEYDNGRSIMNRLISNCLLEVFTEGEHVRRVKMHDLLRDMALRIAKSRFLVKAGTMLEKAPDVQEWSMNLEKISLMRNWRLYIPLEMSPPKCPRLTTLLLSDCDIAMSRAHNIVVVSMQYSEYSRTIFKHMDALKILDLSWNPIKSLPISLSKCPGLTTLLLSDCRIESIPESFFDDTNELKILDLSFNPIKSLPHSLSNLKNLTSLLLAYCEDLGSVPSLSNLKNLISLLLAYCKDLENVPSLSNLKVLKKLDLQRTYIKQIPQGMENLVSLEYLNLDQSKNLNEIPNGILSRLACLQHLIVEGTLISGKEVGGLKKLEILKGRFYDWHNLHMYLQTCRGREEPRQYIISVGGVLWHAVGKEVRKDIVVCGCNIYSYQIMLPRDIKGLRIWDCNVDCSEEYPLFSRFILSSIGSFSYLKFLHIYDCGNMRKLFSPDCVPLNLQELRVVGCEQVEEIIASEVDERVMVTVEFRLPQLRILKLCSLPELKSICSVDSVVVCDSLVEIEVLKCPKLKRMGLNLPLPDNVPPSASAYVPPPSLLAKPNLHLPILFFHAERRYSHLQLTHLPRSSSPQLSPQTTTAVLLTSPRTTLGHRSQVAPANFRTRHKTQTPTMLNRHQQSSRIEPKWSRAYELLLVGTVKHELLLGSSISRGKQLLGSCARLVEQQDMGLTREPATLQLQLCCFTWEVTRSQLGAEPCLLGCSAGRVMSGQAWTLVGDAWKGVE
ncbi:probable disease resistance protein At4g27220 [Hibiscus syriacus]|uniref:probable disease resistance protein At4g27220 n=1 Tax=Hibiscus syriacus TaxID=106335 RepID=UPI001920A8F3|nr:probable disease resistance protein At4g27220 [Hibiscus syriacus]